MHNPGSLKWSLQAQLHVHSLQLHLASSTETVALAFGLLGVFGWVIFFFLWKNLLLTVKLRKSFIFWKCANNSLPHNKQKLTPPTIPARQHDT